jgi:selenium metabolism protein YedF
MKYGIDARGLTCPQPVILTKNSMKNYSQIEILVDNETALENIRRLSENSGWSFSYVPAGDCFTISITAKNTLESNSASQATQLPQCKQETVVVFSSDKMGRGDDDLGSILIKAFIHTLTSLDSIPGKIIFYNSGVNLTAEGSGVTDDLELLQSKGTEILICGTCVNYYKIGDKIKTGIISNMLDILNTMNSAGRIINP